MLSADSSRSSLSKNFPRWSTKAAILLTISLGLFVFSEQFSPPTIFEPKSLGWTLWVSYAKDLIQPCALYLVLCLAEKWLKTSRLRAWIVFTFLILLEFGQALYYRVDSGHYVGSFDPLDIIMYAIGVGVAVMAEEKVCAKLLKP